MALAAPAAAAAAVVDTRDCDRSARNTTLLRAARRGDAVMLIAVAAAGADIAGAADECGLTAAMRVVCTLPRPYTCMIWLSKICCITDRSITVLQLCTTITSWKTFFEFCSERVSRSRYR